MLPTPSRAGWPLGRSASPPGRGLCRRAQPGCPRRKVIIQPQPEQDRMRRTGTCAGVSAIASLGALAAAPVASAGWLLPESGGSANADSIAELYLVVLVIAGVIFFAVTGTLVYFLVRYRKRRGAVAEQIHGNTQLEVAWTA